MKLKKTRMIRKREKSNVKVGNRSDDAKEEGDREKVHKGGELVGIA